MQTLTYSTNETSKLNEARRSLWVNKFMLGAASAEPERYSKSLFMGAINRDRAELRKVARAIRAKLPAQTRYRVELQGDVITFAVYEWAHNKCQAKKRASHRHPHFEVKRVD